MTKQEFETRVKVEVTYTEFDAINTVYMGSDLDKDEFCKVWVSMNKSRVAEAKALAEVEAYNAKKAEYLFNLYHKYRNSSSEALYFDALTDKEIKKLESYGFSMTEKVYSQSANEWFDTPKRMGTILYNIHRMYMSIHRMYMA